MATNEMFDSAFRSAGDLAGVFEYDGETVYFYLLKAAEGQKVVDAIQILAGEPDFDEADLSLRWAVDDQKVGLFIRGVLWAVFDSRRKMKYGGSYKPGAKPSLPIEIEKLFGVS